MALAQVVEQNGVLTVKQTNGAPLRDLGTVLLQIPPAAAVLLLFYVECGTDKGLFVFMSLFGGGYYVYQLFRTINQLWSRETFVFDRNADTFIRNGRIVCSLRDIRLIAAQVTRGEAQNPKFRVLLELPRCQEVSIAETYSLYRRGDFSLSRNDFDDPNERFAVFTPWLDCDKQRLVPFVPPEIEELRRKISAFVAESAPVIAGRGG